MNTQKFEWTIDCECVIFDTNFPTTYRKVDLMITEAMHIAVTRRGVVPRSFVEMIRSGNLNSVACSEVEIRMHPTVR